MSCLALTIVGAGLLLGALAAGAILLAQLLAARFAPEGSLFDVLLRLLVFGLLLLGVSEVIGTYLGSEVRQHALAFWLAFTLSFIGVPTLLHLQSQARVRRKD